MTVFDPLNDKISVYSSTLADISETNSYAMALRTLMSGGAITLTPNQSTGQMIIDAPNNYFTTVATDGVTMSGHGTEASPLVSLIPPIVLTPTSLTSGTIETWYDVTFAATGGSGAGYTFAITSGALPAGMTLSSSGVLSGTPTQFGAFQFYVTATDSWGITGSVDYTLSLSSITLNINPTTLSSGIIGAPYTNTLTDANGTGGDTFTVTSGTLPLGLSLASNGAISGTPASIGSWTFTVSTSDSAGDTGTITYTMPVISNLVISPLSLVSGAIGVTYAQTFSATGGSGTGYSYSVLSGTLPPGLSLSGATISGQPTSAGTSNFTILLQDTAGNDKQYNYSITISHVGLTLSPGSMGNGAICYPYNVSVSAVGGLGYGYTYSVSSGSLPPGLGFSGNTISGTITGTGTFNFTISVSDTAGDTGSQNYSIYVPAVQGGSVYYDGNNGEEGDWNLRYDALQGATVSGSYQTPDQFNWFAIEVWGGGGGGGSNGWQGGAIGGPTACGPVYASAGGGGDGLGSGGAGGGGGGGVGGNIENSVGSSGSPGSIYSSGNGGNSPHGGAGGAAFGGEGAYPYSGQGGNPGGGAGGADGYGSSTSSSVTGGGGGGGGGGYARYQWSAGQLPSQAVTYTIGGGGKGGIAGTTWQNGAGGAAGRVAFSWG